MGQPLLMSTSVNFFVSFFFLNSVEKQDLKAIMVALQVETDLQERE